MVWFLKSKGLVSGSDEARHAENDEPQANGNGRACCCGRGQGRSSRGCSNDGVEAYDHSSLDRIFEANR
jgi:hypothetical protein